MKNYLLKILSLIIVCAMTATMLVSCGNDDNSSETGSSAAVSSGDVSEASEASESSEADTSKEGSIDDSGILAKIGGITQNQTVAKTLASFKVAMKQAFISNTEISVGKVTSMGVESDLGAYLKSSVQYSGKNAVSKANVELGFAEEKIASDIYYNDADKSIYVELDKIEKPILGNVAELIESSESEHGELTEDGSSITESSAGDGDVGVKFAKLVKYATPEMMADVLGSYDTFISAISSSDDFVSKYVDALFSSVSESSIKYSKEKVVYSGSYVTGEYDVDVKTGTFTHEDFNSGVSAVLDVLKADETGKNLIKLYYDMIKSVAPADEEIPSFEEVWAFIDLAKQKFTTENTDDAETVEISVKSIDGKLAGLAFKSEDDSTGIDYIVDGNNYAIVMSYNGEKVVTIDGNANGFDIIFNSEEAEVKLICKVSDTKIELALSVITPYETYDPETYEPIITNEQIDLSLDFTIEECTEKTYKFVSNIDVKISMEDPATKTLMDVAAIPVEIKGQYELSENASQIVMPKVTGDAYTLTKSEETEETEELLQDIQTSYSGLITKLQMLLF